MEELNTNEVYELQGHEVKEETIEKTPDCEIITTKYFSKDKLVRVDKTINVDPLFVAKLSSNLT